MKNKVTTLVVLNYAMNSGSPLLSHQVDVVCKLSESFEKVIVVTGQVGLVSVPKNVEIFSTNWSNNRNLRNTYSLVRTFFKHKPKGDYVVFTHMADVHAAILSPFIYLLGRRHVLWYAHAYVSKFLSFSNLLVSEILTASSGSCNLKSKKVRVIGHGVDENNFEFFESDLYRLNQFVTIGRLDPSKNFDLILSFFSTIAEIDPGALLSSYGNPTTSLARHKLQLLLNNFNEIIESKRVVINPSILRSEVPSILKSHGLFVHAYGGSLDKSVLEATLCGLPVLSINPEYNEIFGVWGGKSNSFSFINQYNSLQNLSHADLKNELARRRDLCVSNHSLTHWAAEVVASLLK